MFIQNMKIRLAFIKADKLNFFVKSGVFIFFISIFSIFIYSHTQDIYSIFEGIFIQKKEIIIIKPELPVTISVLNEKSQGGSWFHWSSYSSNQKILIGVLGISCVIVISGVTFYLVGGALPLIGETISSIGEVLPNSGEAISVIGGTISAVGATTMANEGEIISDFGVSADYLANKREFILSLAELISNDKDENNSTINTSMINTSSSSSSVSSDDDDLPLYPPYPYLVYSYPSSSSSDEEEDFSSLEGSIFDSGNIDIFLDFSV